jgi:hypothetical protein
LIICFFPTTNLLNSGETGNDNLSMGTFKGFPPAVRLQGVLGLTTNERA